MAHVNNVLHHILCFADIESEFVRVFGKTHETCIHSHPAATSQRNARHRIVDMQDAAPQLTGLGAGTRKIASK